MNKLKQAFEKRERSRQRTNEVSDLTQIYEQLPEDARFYIEAMGNSPELMRLAIQAHDQACISHAPAPDRIPCSGDPEDNDDYITSFVHNYCVLEKAAIA